jgi:hypothetical protein
VPPGSSTAAARALVPSSRIAFGLKRIIYGSGTVLPQRGRVLHLIEEVIPVLAFALVSGSTSQRFAARGVSLCSASAAFVPRSEHAAAGLLEVTSRLTGGSHVRLVGGLPLLEGLHHAGREDCMRSAGPGDRRPGVRAGGGGGMACCRALVIGVGSQRPCTTRSFRNCGVTADAAAGGLLQAPPAARCPACASLWYGSPQRAAVRRRDGSGL